MNDDVWTVLAIEPTSDEREIRRAYAARLRVVRPESDPDGFQRLRRAYEWALAEIRHAAPAGVTREPYDAPTPDAPPPDDDRGARFAHEVAMQRLSDEALAVEANALLASCRPLKADEATLERNIDALLARVPLAQRDELESLLAGGIATAGPWSAAALACLARKLEWDALRLAAGPPVLRHPEFLRWLDWALAQVYDEPLPARPPGFRLQVAIAVLSWLALSIVQALLGESIGPALPDWLRAFLFDSRLVSAGVLLTWTGLVVRHWRRRR